MENSVDESLNSSEMTPNPKQKRHFPVEKIGESEEYDQSLLKRRKKKLVGKGITVALPKKNLTAYAIFVKQKRREMQDCAEFNSKSPDMMKKLGKIWSNMSKEERKTYEEVARKDKERYDTEMKKLTDSGRTIEKLHEVEHKRPKKCLSAYMIFVKDVRSKVSNANPDMPVLQIMKEVGKRWQSLTPPEKKVYQDLADTDKIRYKNQLKEFEKEVEKLQIVKPGKGRGSKTKPKVDEIKIDSPKPILKQSQPVKQVSEHKPQEKSRIQLQKERNITIEIKDKETCDSTPNITSKKTMNLNESMPKQSSGIRKDSFFNPLYDKQTTPSPIVKDDNLIKRPLNIYKSDGQQLTSRPVPEKYGNFEYRKYKMQADPYSYQKQDGGDQPAVAMDYRMSVDASTNDNYNRIFPDGMSPPILDHRKRNRRISSIVGVSSNANLGGSEVEDIFDSKYNDGKQPNSRKASVEFNMGNEATSSYYNEQRKNSMQYFAGMIRSNSIDSNFAQHPMFKSNNDGSSGDRKQSSNFPFPDPS